MRAVAPYLGKGKIKRLKARNLNGLQNISDFGAGLIGGCVALLVGVPMPFMLGGLLGAASFVIFYENRGTQLPKLSNTFSSSFHGIDWRNYRHAFFTRTFPSASRFLDFCCSVNSIYFDRSFG